MGSVGFCRVHLAGDAGPLVFVTSRKGMLLCRSCLRDDWRNYYVCHVGSARE